MRTCLILVSLVLAGCASASTGRDGDRAIPPSPSTSAEDVVVDVYASPTCGCCDDWEAYLRSHGYTVRSIPTEDMAGTKARYGLPQSAWSCHTAVIAGYVVEGHVPVAAIQDLLDSRPAIDGIALPAMPAGSPGMPGVKEHAFDILAIDDGATSSFGSY